MATILKKATSKVFAASVVVGTFDDIAAVLGLQTTDTEIASLSEAVATTVTLGHSSSRYSADYPGDPGSRLSRIVQTLSGEHKDGVSGAKSVPDFAFNYELNS